MKKDGILYWACKVVVTYLFVEQESGVQFSVCPPLLQP